MSLSGTTHFKALCPLHQTMLWCNVAQTCTMYSSHVLIFPCGTIPALKSSFCVGFCCNLQNPIVNNALLACLPWNTFQSCYCSSRAPHSINCLVLIQAGDRSKYCMADIFHRPFSHMSVFKQKHEQDTFCGWQKFLEFSFIQNSRTQ